MSTPLTNQQVAAMQHHLFQKGELLTNRERHSLLTGNFTKVKTSEKKMGSDGKLHWKEKIVIH